MSFTLQYFYAAARGGRSASPAAARRGGIGREPHFIFAPFVKMTQAPLVFGPASPYGHVCRVFNRRRGLAISRPLTTSFLKHRCDTGAIDWRSLTYDSKDALYDYGNCEVV
jgi:hypothetical protein